MKKEYIEPELIIRKVSFIQDVLVISTTDPSYIDEEIPTGGNTVPEDDPFA